MVKCSICARNIKNSSKEWDLKKIHVKQYECCGKKVREYLSKKTIEKTMKTIEKKSFLSRLKAVFTQ